MRAPWESIAYHHPVCFGTAALAYAAIAATAIGTGVSVYGQVQAADSQKQQANYEARVAANNAILAQRAAADATARGKQQEEQAAIAGKQLLGRQRAVLAGNGVLVDTGSAEDITTSQAGQNKLAELTIRSNAQREALGFEAQGTNFSAQSGLDTLAGNNAYAAGMTSAAGSLLSGAGTVAAKWYDYKQNVPL